MLVNTVICVLGIGNRCTENSMKGSTGEKRSVVVAKRKGVIKKTRTPNERLELSLLKCKEYASPDTLNSNMHCR